MFCQRAQPSNEEEYVPQEEHVCTAFVKECLLHERLLCGAGLRDGGSEGLPETVSHDRIPLADRVCEREKEVAECCALTGAELLVPKGVITRLCNGGSVGRCPGSPGGRGCNPENDPFQVFLCWGWVPRSVAIEDYRDGHVRGGFGGGS